MEPLGCGSSSSILFHSLTGEQLGQSHKHVIEVDYRMPVFCFLVVQIIAETYVELLCIGTLNQEVHTSLK